MIILILSSVVVFFYKCKCKKAILGFSFTVYKGWKNIKDAKRRLFYEEAVHNQSVNRRSKPIHRLLTESHMKAFSYNNDARSVSFFVPTIHYCVIFASKWPLFPFQSLPFHSIENRKSDKRWKYNNCKMSITLRRFHFHRSTSSIHFHFVAKFVPLFFG